MIMQKLCEYYQRRLLEDRKRAQKDGSEIAPPGYSKAKISFALLLDESGQLCGQKVMDLPDEEQKNRLLVPEAAKRSRNIASNFMWDNSSYVLGIDKDGVTDKATKCIRAFQDFHRQLCQYSDDVGAKAVLSFLENWNPNEPPELPFRDEIVKGANLIFALSQRGSLSRIHERPAIRAIWEQHCAQRQGQDCGQCLISGQTEVPIARLHPKIKGVMGAQTSGATIAGFNFKAVESFRKEQTLNAPVSEECAFQYTTALNSLLEKGSPQRVFIGETTTVFWAEKKDKSENLAALLFNVPQIKDGDGDGATDDPGTAKLIRDVLRAAKQGKPSNALLHEICDDPNVKLYILGLAPNAARISIRFWETISLRNLLQNVAKHYAQMEIEGMKTEFPSIRMILKQTAFQGKQDKVSPRLGGELMQAVFSGAHYPMSIYTAILTRIRADQIVNSTRAAMLKAVLLRNYPNTNKEIITMALNKETTDAAYRLGRLFCVLEGLQYSAVKPSATIKDRFYGAASATPASVFPQLLRNVQHHIGKLSYGDKYIEEILIGIDEFPAHLNIQEQGRFTLGYYHQRTDRFKKTTTSNEEK